MKKPYWIVVEQYNAGDNWEIEYESYEKKDVISKTKEKKNAGCTVETIFIPDHDGTRQQIDDALTVFNGLHSVKHLTSKSITKMKQEETKKAAKNIISIFMKPGEAQYDIWLDYIEKRIELIIDSVDIFNRLIAECMIVENNHFFETTNLERITEEEEEEEEEEKEEEEE